MNRGFEVPAHPESETGILIQDAFRCAEEGYREDHILDCGVNHPAYACLNLPPHHRRGCDLRLHRLVPPFGIQDEERYGNLEADIDHHPAEDRPRALKDPSGREVGRAGDQ